jgi:hypothetical protein
MMRPCTVYAIALMTTTTRGVGGGDETKTNANDLNSLIQVNLDSNSPGGAFPVFAGLAPSLKRTAG